MLYSNLEESKSNWQPVLKEHACQYVEHSRIGDCNSLTRALLEDQAEYFDNTRLSQEELQLPRESLREVVQDRSTVLCRNYACCPIIEPHDVLIPSGRVGTAELRDEIRNANNERLAVQKEKMALDELRADVSNRQLEMDSEKEELDREKEDIQLQRTDLEQSQASLLSEQESLTKRKKNIKMREQELIAWQHDLEELEAALEKDSAERQGLSHISVPSDLEPSPLEPANSAGTKNPLAGTPSAGTPTAASQPSFSAIKSSSRSTLHLQPLRHRFDSKGLYIQKKQTKK